MSFYPSSWARGLARELERGRRGSVSRVASGMWAEIARQSLVKKVHFRPTAHIVAIGGATLGGSGKTPLAIAVTRHLARRGGRVALVGHGYGGRRTSARRVGVDDSLASVGDESLLAARVLAPLGIPVVVAPTRQEALDLALRYADVAVLDGTLQLAPVRARLSLLSLDSSAPWGSAACPPLGDLRAPTDALLATSDMAVRIGPPDDSDAEAYVVSRGAFVGGGLVGWGELRQHRIGLSTSVARPHRVVSMLRSEGIDPALIVHHSDHALVGANRIIGMMHEGRKRGVTLWLTTAKCSLASLCSCLGEVPVATIEYDLRLRGRLEDALDAMLAWND